MIPSKLQLHPSYGLDVVLKEFQDGHCGSDLGYWNGKALEILNPHVSPVPPTKFWLNPTYPSGADVI